MGALALSQSVCLFCDGFSKGNFHIVNEVLTVSEFGFDKVEKTVSHLQVVANGINTFRAIFVRYG